METFKHLKKAVQGVVAPDPLGAYKLAEGQQQADYHRLVRTVQAVDRSTGEAVTAWICSLRSITERTSSPDEAALTSKSIMEGAQMLARVRHPNVLRVIVPAVEDKHRERIVFVTERVEHNVAMLLLGQHDYSSVELYYGLWQVGEALQFLHNRGNILALNFSPWSIVTTADGAWKLGCLTHAVHLVEGNQVKQYRVPHGFLSVSAPILDYVAPEVADGNDSTNNLLGSTSGSLDRPTLPDSDVFSFIFTAAFVLRKARLLNTGGELAMYRRQVTDAERQVKTLFPIWGANWGSAGAATPSQRPQLSLLLSTEGFESREVRLLIDLATHATLEPRAKLQLFKGLHDALAASSIPPRLISNIVVPILLEESIETRMLKFTTPILLEAAQVPPGEPLRLFIMQLVQRVTQANRSELDDILLQQLLEKFPRYWRHFAADPNHSMQRLISTGLNSKLQLAVVHGSEALRTLLTSNEKLARTVPGDEMASHLLSGVILFPQSAQVAVRCLSLLLPLTTRSGREELLEPKIVAGIRQLSETPSSSAEDLHTLLQILTTVVHESGLEHLAAVTLPLLTPLLVMERKDAREKITAMVQEIVRTVAEKANQKFDDSLQKQTAAVAPPPSLVSVPRPTLAEMNAGQSKANDSTSFFDRSGGHRPSPLIHPAGQNAHLHNKSTAATVDPRVSDEVAQAFGF